MRNRVVLFADRFPRRWLRACVGLTNARCCDRSLAFCQRCPVDWERHAATTLEVFDPAGPLGGMLQVQEKERGTLPFVALPRPKTDAFACGAAAGQGQRARRAP